MKPGFIPDNVQRMWPGYEPRREQEQMSALVQETISGGGMLAIEAGTGVGKTLAYLVPLLRAALEQETRVVVSTETVALQRQILGGDLELACKILGKEIRAELCLGASNYLCKRRLADIVSRGEVPIRMSSHLDEFLEWEEETATGVRSDYGGPMISEFWDKIGRDPDDCLGRRCPNFEVSYYFVAKERWRRAQLLVVNHSLLTAHMLRENRILPEFKHIVIDEAHRFPEYYVRSAALTAGFAEMHALLRETGAGSERLRRALDTFRTAAANALGLFPGQRKRLRDDFVSDACDELIELYDAKTAELTEKAADNAENQESQVQAAKMRVHRALVDRLSRSPDNGWVHWASRPDNDNKMNLTLVASPVIGGPAIKGSLRSQAESVIFTSATLASSGREPFGYFLREVGWNDDAADRARTVRLDSPFDYGRRCLLYLPDKIPDPQDEQAFHATCADQIVKLIELSEGGAFVLFTSVRSLTAVRALLQDRSDKAELTIYDQVEMGPSRALALFQESHRGALFGLATFWQGVDIPGDRLRMVILVRIPFRVPDDPALEARMELEQAQGRNPFAAVQLPQAVISMKQGFGRLIRSKSDRGVVAVLDPRIRTKYYGKEILASLPKARLAKNWQDLKTLYDELFLEKTQATAERRNADN